MAARKRFGAMLDSAVDGPILIAKEPKRGNRHVCRGLRLSDRCRPRPEASCGDSKEGTFLELSLNGRADLIITGDEDLLAMNPGCGIAVVSAKST